MVHGHDFMVHLDSGMSKLLGAHDESFLIQAYSIVKARDLLLKRMSCICGEVLHG